MPSRWSLATACLTAATLLATGTPPLARADDTERLLVIKDHRFVPAELKVPANQAIKLTVRNDDDAAEEFESEKLHREKVVPPRTSIVIHLGPLKAGRYPFFGEFHAETAKGTLIVE